MTDRPTDRPPTSPEALLVRLVELGIDAATHHHPPVFTVEESRALRGALPGGPLPGGPLPGGHCKSLFLKDKKGQLWLVVALEDAVIDLKRLHEPLGAARLSFAGADVMARVLGVRPGSVTPFGLINDREHRVDVVLDRAMMAQEWLNYHPLENDRTTTIRSTDLLRFIAACGHTPRLLDVAGS